MNEEVRVDVESPFQQTAEDFVVGKLRVYAEPPQLWDYVAINSLPKKNG